MADGIVQVPVDSTGKKIDVASMDVGANTVYRQRMVIGDNSATAQFATVTGGALAVTGTLNISAMPTVTVTGGVGISGTATVAGSVGATVTGLVGLTAGAANIGFINHISRTVEVTISTPFTINNISASVAVTGNFSATSTVVIAAGTSNIGTLNNISATVNTVAVIGAFLDPSGQSRNLVDSANLALRVNVVAGSGAGANPVSIAAGTSNIGFINNISATVNTASIIGGFRDPSGDLRNVVDSANSALRVNVVAGSGAGANPVSIAAGTSNIGFINNISATVIVAGVVSLGAGTANIGSINNISATVSVINAAGTANIGGVSLVAGTSNIGFINNISATVIVAGVVNLSLTANVVVGAGTSNIGSINNISATVQVAIGTPFTINAVSATVTCVVSNFRDPSGTVVNPIDSVNTAIRVNIVAGSSGGVSQVDGTSFTTQAANFCAIGGIFNDTSPNSLSEKDAGVVRLTTMRAMHVNLRKQDGTEIDLSSTPSVVLAVGTNNFGTLNNISATVMVAGTVSLGAGTNLIGAVSNAAGTALMGAVSLAAGTANIGFINNISATVSVINVAGTANIGAVSLAAGTSNIGFINNISATVMVTTANTYVVNIPSASHGPKMVLASTSANVTLIASPGNGLSVYITHLAITNGGTINTAARVGTSASIQATVMFCASAGGGFVLNFDPPWKLSASEAAICSVKPNSSGNCYFNVNFFVAA